MAPTANPDKMIAVPEDTLVNRQLIKAVAKGDGDQVGQLLASGANANTTRRSQMQTVLHMALGHVEEDRGALAEQLLAAGAHPFYLERHASVDKMVRVGYFNAIARLIDVNAPAEMVIDWMARFPQSWSAAPLDLDGKEIVYTSAREQVWLALMHSRNDALRTAVLAQYPQLLGTQSRDFLMNCLQGGVVSGMQNLQPTSEAAALMLEATAPRSRAENAHLLRLTLHSINYPKTTAARLVLELTKNGSVAWDEPLLEPGEQLFWPVCPWKSPAFSGNTVPLYRFVLQHDHREAVHALQRSGAVTPDQTERWNTLLNECGTFSAVYCFKDAWGQSNPAQRNAFRQQTVSPWHSWVEGGTFQINRNTHGAHQQRLVKLWQAAKVPLGPDAAGRSVGQAWLSYTMARLDELAAIQPNPKALNAEINRLTKVMLPQLLQLVRTREEWEAPFPSWNGTPGPSLAEQLGDLDGPALGISPHRQALWEALSPILAPHMAGWSLTQTLRHQSAHQSAPRRPRL